MDFKDFITSIDLFLFKRQKPVFTENKISYRNILSLIVLIIYFGLITWLSLQHKNNANLHNTVFMDKYNLASVINNQTNNTNNLKNMVVFNYSISYDLEAANLPDGCVLTTSLFSREKKVGNFSNFLSNCKKSEDKGKNLNIKCGSIKSEVYNVTFEELLNQNPNQIYDINNDMNEYIDFSMFNIMNFDIKCKKGVFAEYKKNTKVFDIKLVLKSPTTDFDVLNDEKPFNNSSNSYRAYLLPGVIGSFIGLKYPTYKHYSIIEYYKINALYNDNNFYYKSQFTKDYLQKKFNFLQSSLIKDETRVESNFSTSENDEEFHYLNFAKIYFRVDPYDVKIILRSYYTVPELLVSSFILLFLVIFITSLIILPIDYNLYYTENINNLFNFQSYNKSEMNTFYSNLNKINKDSKRQSLNISVINSTTIKTREKKGSNTKNPSIKSKKNICKCKSPRLDYNLNCISCISKVKPNQTASSSKSLETITQERLNSLEREKNTISFNKTGKESMMFGDTNCKENNFSHKNNNEIFYRDEQENKNVSSPYRETSSFHEKPKKEENKAYLTYHTHDLLNYTSPDYINQVSPSNLKVECKNKTFIKSSLKECKDNISVNKLEQTANLTSKIDDSYMSDNLFDKASKINKSTYCFNNNTSNNSQEIKESHKPSPDNDCNLYLFETNYNREENKKLKSKTDYIKNINSFMSISNSNDANYTSPKNANKQKIFDESIRYSQQNTINNSKYNNKDQIINEKDGKSCITSTTLANVKLLKGINKKKCCDDSILTFTENTQKKSLLGGFHNQITIQKDVKSNEKNKNIPIITNNSFNISSSIYYYLCGCCLQKNNRFKKQIFEECKKVLDGYSSTNFQYEFAYILERDLKKLYSNNNTKLFSLHYTNSLEKFYFVKTNNK